jgi:RES domain-containing protein
VEQRGGVPALYRRKRLFSHAEIPGHQLPLNWREHPPPDLLKAWGDQFSEEGSYLALKVPSVLVPQEFNYLLNPSHPAFKKIKVVTQDIVRIDERLLKGN